MKQNNIMVDQVEAMVSAGMLRELHTAWHRGYVSRRSQGYVSVYNGRYGSGYIIDRPSARSTQYCLRTYYIYSK